MKNKLLILIAFMGLGSWPSYALEPASSLKIENFEQLNLKNPFESQLPVAIPVVPVKTQPVTPSSRVQTVPEDSSEVIVEDPYAGLLESLAITGVVWNSERPQAIINGQVISEGDQFMEFQVTQIQKEQIVLTVQGQQYFITP